MMKNNPVTASLYIFTLVVILFGCFVSSLAEEPVIQSAEEEAGQQPIQEAQDKKLPVDLELKEADIREVARAFSRISGINIIVSDEVKAKVTLRVQSMDWREALNMILGAYNLTVLEREDYIVITTIERRRLVEEGGELKTQVISLNFVNVGDLQNTLKSMLTPRGKIEMDTRTNSLVITDIKERIEQIQRVAVELDTRTPQVMIEAMMLDVKLTNEFQLGIDWTITHESHNFGSTTTPDKHTIDGKQTLSLTSTTTGAFQLGKSIFPWAYFSSLIEMLQQQKKVDILANPRVMTLDNLTANIELIEQIAYTSESTTDQGTVTSTQFKDAGIKLYVKPHITKDNHIFLNIKTEQSYESGRSNNQPIIDSRKSETNLMVKDGETIVIGGLRKKQDTITIDKFPILGDIPVLGNMFKRNNINKVDTELLIFVTPHVVADSVLSAGETGHLDAFNKMKAGKEFSSFKKVDPFPLRPPSTTQ